MSFLIIVVLLGGLIGVGYCAVRYIVRGGMWSLAALVLATGVVFVTHASQSHFNSLPSTMMFAAFPAILCGLWLGRYKPSGGVGKR